MKHLMLIYVGIIIILIYSCKKEYSAVINNSSSIIGKWELRQVAANFTTNLTSGNGSTIEFSNSSYSTTDSTYSFFIQGNHHKKGYYKIIPDLSVSICTGLLISQGQFGNRIILDNDTTSDKIFYQITNNKLLILSGYFPLDSGTKMTYEKQ